MDFVESETMPGDMPLAKWAERYVSHLTGIDVRTREDCMREVRVRFTLIQHTAPTALSFPATICDLTRDDVTDWVRVEQGLPEPSRMAVLFGTGQGPLPCAGHARASMALVISARASAP
ncbi:hypothetical protein [Streptomyces sp. NPDC006368]|uniref:hypothetical protein n=1 Tax=Streptomyces sp. NPDC006368 TaxID=3156760 RepID=UPI0033A8C9B4